MLSRAVRSFGDFRTIFMESDLSRIVALTGSGWSIGSAPRVDRKAWDTALHAVRDGLRPPPGRIPVHRYARRELTRQLAGTVKSLARSFRDDRGACVECPR